MKRIIVLNENGMRRAKTAMLTMVTRGDTCRIGDTWISLQDPSLQLETYVDEVSHFGRHTTAAGDVIEVLGITKTPIAQVQVQSIQLRHTDSFTTDDYAALGYSSSTDYATDWGKVVAGRVWWMQIERVTPQSGMSSLPQ